MISHTLRLDPRVFASAGEGTGIGTHRCSVACPYAAATHGG